MGMIRSSRPVISTRARSGFAGRYDFDISARSCALPSPLFMAGTLFITSQLPIKRYESLLSRLAGKLETFGEL
jgi:hypothetical protein